MVGRVSRVWVLLRYSNMGAIKLQHQGDEFWGAVTL
jgi:hypothetical protein